MMRNKKKDQVSDSDTSVKNEISSPKSQKSPVKKSPKKKPKKNSEEDNNNSRIKENEKNNSQNSASSEDDGDIIPETQNDPTNNEENNKGAHSDVKKATFTVEELSPDDEIYILQCPDGFDKQELINKTLDFSKSKKFKSKTKEVYKLEIINARKKFVTLAMPSKTSDGCLINLPLKGHILIEKTVDRTVNNDKNFIEEESDEVIEFPDDLVMRHPLLGTEWKTHVDIANDAIKRFKKKLKKNKRERPVDFEVAEKVKKEPSSADSSPKKKKRKT